MQITIVVAICNQTYNDDDDFRLLQYWVEFTHSYGSGPSTQPKYPLVL